MKPLTLASIKSFYVGGGIRATENRLFGADIQSCGAMYVQCWTPAERTFPVPVVFIHGGMHTGVTWETTPDGREGWQSLFARSGFETLVVDQAWRGRSSPDLTGLNPLCATQEVVGPAFTCGQRIAEVFARGGTRFPNASVRTYAAQLWPDFFVSSAIACGTPGLSDPRALTPLIELIDRFAPVALVTHSQGADLGWKLACARPQQILAILAVEPALTCPGLDDELLAHIPVRVMWGDNLAPSGPLSLVDLEQARAIAAARSTVEVDFLPELGIHGNGHMLMMEDNSGELAERAMRWLTSVVSR